MLSTCELPGGLHEITCCGWKLYSCFHVASAVADTDRWTLLAALNNPTECLTACVLQGVLSHIINPVRQLYERIPVASAAADADTRFEHFTKRAWPRIKEAGSSGERGAPAPAPEISASRCSALLCCMVGLSVTPVQHGLALDRHPRVS